MRKLLILALLPMLFVSCSKDDSNETPQEPDKREQQIVGKWLVTDYWWTYSGLGYADEAHWKEVHGDLTVTFNSGGTCNVTGKSYETVTTSFDTSFDLQVDFPEINRWKWNKDNPTYPLKVYYVSGGELDLGVTFVTNNKLELKNGGYGYKLKRQ